MYVTIFVTWRSRGAFVKFTVAPVMRHGHRPHDIRRSRRYLPYFPDLPMRFIVMLVYGKSLAQLWNPRRRGHADLVDALLYATLQSISVRDCLPSCRCVKSRAILLFANSDIETIFLEYIQHEDNSFVSSRVTTLSRHRTPNEMISRWRTSSWEDIFHILILILVLPPSDSIESRAFASCLSSKRSPKDRI